MRKNIDLTNRRFGKLVVLRKVDDDSIRGTVWECRCDCGNIIRENTSNLNANLRVSCGCARKAPRRRIDLAGKKYGKLLVIKKSFKWVNQRKVTGWECQCECGEKTFATTGQLKSGDKISCGCARKEANKKRRGIGKLSKEEAQAVLDEYGYEFGEAYIAATKVMKIICPIHKEFKSSISKLKQGYRYCPKCREEKKHETKWTDEKLKKLAESCNQIYLRKEGYGNDTRVFFQCRKHGEKSLKRKRFIDNPLCPECKKEINIDKRKISKDDVRAMVEKNGFIWIEQDYVNANSDIEVRCPKHGKKKTRYAWLYLGHGCKECANEASKKDFDIIKKEIERRGVFVLSTEDDYKDNQSLLDLWCPNHGPFQQTWARISSNEWRCCPDCGHERQGLAIRGEKSPSWKGGRDSLTSQLRNVIRPWVDVQLKNENYECELTHQKGILEVHHMYKFSEIVERCFEDLRLDIRENTSDYTDEEWRRITRHLIELNERLANPVVMLKSMHTAFHHFCDGHLKPTSFRQLKEFCDSNSYTFPKRYIDKLCEKHR